MRASIGSFRKSRPQRGACDVLMVPAPALDGLTGEVIAAVWPVTVLSPDSRGRPARRYLHTFTSLGKSDGRGDREAAETVRSWRSQRSSVDAPPAPTTGRGEFRRGFGLSFPSNLAESDALAEQGDGIAGYCTTVREMAEAFQGRWDMVPLRSVCQR